MDFDVIIAGAGPAGAVCALTLRNAGLKVVLIDKSTFPRDKICGDAIPGRSFNVLKELDPRFLERFEKLKTTSRTYSTRVVSSFGFEFNMNWKSKAYNCTREIFDNFLYNLVETYTNTTLLINKKITNVSIDERSVKLMFDDEAITAKFLIVCDGAQSILAKKLTHFSMDRSHFSGAVRAYYEGVSKLQNGCNEVFFSKKFVPGYFWIFPVSGNLCNVGFGMLSKTISQKKINLKNAFGEVINEFPELKQRFQSAHRIGELQGFGLPLGTRNLPISGNRFVLCGDAASLIDPVSGAGIDTAMISGKLAGEHVMKCFEKDLFSEMENIAFDKMVYSKLGKELRKNTKILRISLFFPWIADVGIFLMSNRNPFSRFIKKMV